MNLEKITKMRRNVIEKEDRTTQKSNSYEDTCYVLKYYRTWTMGYILALPNTISITVTYRMLLPYSVLFA